MGEIDPLLSPTEAKFFSAPIDFLVFNGLDDQRIEEVK
jgi:predicted Holliday junction resolvase-like endonuclease